MQQVLKGCLCAYAALVVVSQAAWADDECWGAGPGSQIPEMTCTMITDDVLTALEGATRAEVIKAMNSNGSPTAPDILYFLSNYRGGEHGFAGPVYFQFGPEGRTDRITAVISPEDNDNGLNEHFEWLKPVTPPDQ